MTSSGVRHFHRDRDVAFFLGDEPRFENWPVVYVLNNTRQVYVGESLNVRNRFHQHRQSKEKEKLTSAFVVVEPTFNKSAALDLESHLVRLLAGDGQFEVLNRNDGIIDADYYDRDKYRERFESIFSQFLELGIFSRPVREIENSDLFKLSPFKALTPDQEKTVEDFLRSLLLSVQAGESTQSVIQGDPGTGKTVVGVYLMKLIRDLGKPIHLGDVDEASVIADPVVADRREFLKDFRIGLVVPQQALRESIKRVFNQTPGLSKTMVLTPFDVGKSEEPFDLLVVDETHRLSRRANMPSAVQNKQYKEINERLFGSDDYSITQLDWIVKQSKHQVLLLDPTQSVRPADLSQQELQSIARGAGEKQRFYPLKSQMRVKSAPEYVAYLRGVLSDGPPVPKAFPGYDLRWFEDVEEMASTLATREKQHGLARMLAGYAWKWVSKKDKSAVDITIGDFKRQWNSADTDWVTSPNAANEVGSIHTIQGYDLNYAGVIFGPDLKFDPETETIYVDRSSYFDQRGKEKSERSGITVSDEELRRWVVSVYLVLLTRGIYGTYIYVCDPDLRDRLRPFFTVKP